MTGQRVHLNAHKAGVLLIGEDTFEFIGEANQSVEFLLARVALTAQAGELQVQAIERINLSRISEA